MNAFISAFLISVSFISGSFNLSRIGFYSFEIRYLFLSILALWCITVLSMRKKISLKKIITADLAAIVLFILLIMITITWSVSIEYGATKFQDLFLTLALVISSAILISTNPDKIIKIIFHIFLLISIIYALTSVLVAMSGSRGTIFIGGPNVATRVMFFGLVSAFFLNELQDRFTYKLYALLIIAGIISIGSRSGFVSAILAPLLFALVYYRPSVTRFFQKLILRAKVNRLRFRVNINLVKLFKLMLIIAIFGVMLLQVWHVFIARIINLLINRLHYAGRDSIYHNFLEIIKENPLFGVGLGGHADYGYMYYPHNLFIELMVDGGLFLLVASFIFFFYILRKGVKQKLPNFFFVLMIYMILVQQFSGGYYDFRYFFLFAICYSFSSFYLVAPRGEGGVKSVEFRTSGPMGWR